jgi:hypothetical protein
VILFLFCKIFLEVRAEKVNHLWLDASSDLDLRRTRLQQPDNLSSSSSPFSQRHPFSSWMIRHGHGRPLLDQFAVPGAAEAGDGELRWLGRRRRQGRWPAPRQDAICSPPRRHRYAQLLVGSGFSFSGHAVSFLTLGREGFCAFTESTTTLSDLDNARCASL